MILKEKKVEIKIEQTYEEYCNEQAKKAAMCSIAEKRKVGAFITAKYDQESEFFEALGFNYNSDDPEASCEDAQGNTLPCVTHAEVAAIENFETDFKLLSKCSESIIYITHPPCDNCKVAIKKAGIKKTIVVEDFLKFDKEKLRYDLIPPSTTKALATVLTHGAKKYKPNNWRRISKDELWRYEAAAMRHFEAHRAGELIDPDSGEPHLYHAITNLAFLIELNDFNREGENNDN